MWRGRWIHFLVFSLLYAFVFPSSAALSNAFGVTLGITASFLGNRYFVLCEVGGTVGDIEGLPFFEAIRQFGQEQPRGSCIYLHLTLLPWIPTAGELKTKPTQHSVKELRSIGIQPDVLVCRSEIELTESEREKIALFTNVPKRAVITALDAKNCIYRIPLMLHDEAGAPRVALNSFQSTMLTPTGMPVQSGHRTEVELGTNLQITSFRHTGGHTLESDFLANVQLGDLPGGAVLKAARCDVLDRPRGDRRL